MINKIKNIFNTKDKKRLLENFLSLTVLQGANYILPLITLPYLVRVLGPEKFGLIMFAQAFIQYFVILTDYGFNLSATREISIHRDNKDKVSEIFSSVMIIKFFLLILSFIIMTIIVFSFEKFRKDWLIYYLTFGIVFGQVLFPVWFFQGMEKMKYITFLNITAKLIFTLSIFIFIRGVADYIYVPLINSLGFILAGFLSIYIIFKNFGINFKLPDKKALKYHIKDSSQFFLSRISLSIYTSTNTFVLGLFTNTKMVGYYSIAEKMYTAVQQLFHPLVNTLYPYVAYKKNVFLYKKIFKLVLLISFFSVIILFFISDKIITLIFGQGLDLSIDVFKILLIALLCVVPSILLGYPFLAALGYSRYANYSVIFGSLFHIMGLIFLVVFDLINIYNIALMVLLTESFVLFYRLYGVFKNRLWRET